MADQPRDWVFAERANAEPTRTFPTLDAIEPEYLADESTCVRALLERARLPGAEAARVIAHARELIERVRENRQTVSGLDAFMGEYDLSSREGIALMCLAEALLRIPDAETADRLIADKLGQADFHAHLGSSESLFVNAATWGLMLTGEFVKPDHHRGLRDVLSQMLTRLGEPIVRTAMRQAMRILGQQFIAGSTIEEAWERSRDGEARLYRYSFDMLGEAAMTAVDAERYMAAYADAIGALGERLESSHEPAENLHAGPSISVKLSALSPRFEVAQWNRAVSELTARVLELATLARAKGIALTLDAEEADRLELTLAVLDRVLDASALADWPGLGIAVQAYQKRGIGVVEWLARRARAAGKIVPVRLVKGAYWDTEIKRAQEQGLDGYPVFTRKTSTDVSYLACAQALLAAAPALYPQFATHNALTLAWVLHVGAGKRFEFQRLHGMGDELYMQFLDEPDAYPCRVYAPVGSHRDLLPYLVRRLLENGANTSFVNRIVDEALPIEEIAQDPVAVTESLGAAIPHPRIPLPRDLYADRKNSAGLNLADRRVLGELADSLARHAPRALRAAPIVANRRDGDGAAAASTKASVARSGKRALDPADHRHVIGHVAFADVATAKRALERASVFFGEWSATPIGARARMLRDAADLLEARRPELVALCVSEAGRTIPDSLDEVRETVDFLRYYAARGEELCGPPVALAGPTGERNTLRNVARGVFVCISPWNFPYAIFTGQIAAALVTGNCAIAKPAEQTSLCGAKIVELLHAAGIPHAALQLVPGEGPTLGPALLGDPRVAGVAFTGSVETAQRINRTLAERPGPLATLIAETGGVNAMIADSSALPEQVVRDTVRSAFNSAGQRCSALRVLCLQRETADRILEMLFGHMAELVIGDPREIATDVGPVIDAQAQDALLDYLERQSERIRFQCELSARHAHGSFVPPTVLELERVVELEGEIFGPVLHVVRYRADRIDALVDDINALGYGLTLGIHSRVEAFAERIAARARIGNVYVNRNMIGAVVGVQPFGGMGLSGTGPKVGGPHYLGRFTTEQALAVNTAAVGGNATLLSLGDSA